MCFHEEMATPEGINSIQGEVEALVSTLWLDANSVYFGQRP
jgi:hypothetical protein